MSSKPLPTTPRPLPFRAASASSGRPNLMDRLKSRPAVAKIPPSPTGRIDEQDDVLNGMTRSLHRRVSGLNLPTAIRTETVQRRVA